MKHIEELLEKYFEGETTCEEERTLRRYFCSEQVPDHLSVYRPLFAYISQEAARHTHSHRFSPLHQLPYRRWTVIIGGMAAAVLLLAGTVRWLTDASQPTNYVIIDGVCYTDRQLVEAKAEEALENVSFTADEISELMFQP